MGIWSKKPIAALHQDAFSTEQPLPRSLGLWHLTAAGIGSTIGAGIFVLTGSVAAQQAGPAVVLSFLLAGLAVFFAGLCYAEFAAMTPVAGSAYSYAYSSFGELMAWIIGWSIMFEYLFSASMVAIGWSGYVTAMLRDAGIHIPPTLSGTPFKVEAGHLIATGAWFDLPAVLLTLACTGFLLLGTRQSATINSLIVAAKVVAVVMLIVVGAKYVNTANWHPFIPENTGEFGSFGWSGVLRGAGITFFSYIGFDTISTLAEDAKDPQRIVPLSLGISLAVCTVLYIGVCLVITGMTSYHQLNVPDPLYFALGTVKADLGWLKMIIAITASVGLLTVMFTCLIGQTRIFYAMGRDGLLPAALSRTSARSHTPHISTLITGVIAAIVAGVLPFGLLGELISIGTLMAFAIVCAGIIALRRTAPDAHRPFRTPWVPWVPVLGIISCLVLMLSLPGDTWIRLIVWLAIGLLIYAAYGRHHAKLNTQQ